MSDGRKYFWENLCLKYAERLTQHPHLEIGDTRPLSPEPVGKRPDQPPPPPKPDPMKPSICSTSGFMADSTKTNPPTIGVTGVMPQGLSYISHKIDGLDELTKAIVSLKETMDRVETRLANIQADLGFNGFPEIKK